MHRSLPACILILLLAAPLGSSSPAQPGRAATAGATTILLDRPQDVFLAVGSTAPQNASEKGAHFDHLDILRLSVGQETDKEFQVQVQFRTLPTSSPAGSTSRRIVFQFGELGWSLQANGCGRQGSPTMGCLSHKDGPAPEDWNSIGEVPMATDQASATHTFTVDKGLIFDEQRAPIRFGAALTNLSVHTSQRYSCGGVCFFGDPGGARFYDDAPEPGLPEPSFRFVKGGKNQGVLGLVSPDPVRVSNGEATSIVYAMEAFNLGPDPIAVEFATEIPPDLLADGWTVRVPAMVRVPGNGVLTLPAILTLPFTHRHGETALFTVRATVLGDPASHSEIELGVFWTKIPQPSGHHEGAGGGTYFHSSPDPWTAPFYALNTVAARYTGWMNSLKDDAQSDATDDAYPADLNEGLLCVFDNSCAIPPESRTTWWFPLRPALMMGLDFDLNRTGKLDVELVSPLRARTATIEAALRYCDPASNVDIECIDLDQHLIVLADGRADVTLDGQPVPVSIPLAPKTAGDYLPFKRFSNIGLAVTLVSDLPQNAFLTDPRPSLVVQKAHMDLPLNEYHDSVQDAFDYVGTLALRVVGAAEKLAKPGGTSVFGFELTNRAKEPQTILLEVDGNNREWARLVGTDRLALSAGETRTVSVEVQVPDAAADGSRAELLLVAQSASDASVIAASGFRSVVTTTLDVPNEGEAAARSAGTGSKASVPGFEAARVFLALGAAWVLGRRGRH